MFMPLSSKGMLSPRLLHRCIQPRHRSFSTNNLMKHLKTLDTACICDADKIYLAQEQGKDIKPIRAGSLYKNIDLLDPKIYRINKETNNEVMIGIVRTVKCTSANDVLALLRGIEEAEEGEVLMVDTSESHRAVAGEILATLAEQKCLAGIVVDGPVRDTAQLQSISVPVYATAISPYAGTIQSPGKMQTSILVGGVRVTPGEIAMGDADGVIVAPIATFDTLLPTAIQIQHDEERVRAKIQAGESIGKVSNYEEHLKARLALEPSQFEFRSEGRQ